MSREHADSELLTGLQRRLDGWRRRHGGRGRGIPDELWREAADLARREGVSVVARVLRLRPERLGRVVAELEDDERPEFVEMAWPLELSAGPVLVQFEAPEADKNSSATRRCASERKGIRDEHLKL